MSENILPKSRTNNAVVHGLNNNVAAYIWVVPRNSNSPGLTAIAGAAKAGSGIPAPKPAVNYDSNETVLGAFGQVSYQIRYTINYTLSGDPVYGGVIENLTFNGQPIDPNREYRIVTSTYLCDGGDGYGSYLYSTARRDTGVMSWRAIAEYIYDQDLPLEPATDGRITLIGAVWSAAH